MHEIAFQHTPPVDMHSHNNHTPGEWMNDWMNVRSDFQKNKTLAICMRICWTAEAIFEFDWAIQWDLGARTACERGRVGKG